MVKLLVYICLSIEETENPQWDTIAISDFDIINSEIAVGHIFNLLKRLAMATNLNRVNIINQEVTVAAEGQLMATEQLIGEECLSDSSDIDVARQGVHQVGVLKIHFLGFHQLLHRALALEQHVDE